MKLVTLDQAKLRLKVDESAMDADIDLMIDGASAMVLNHLGERANAFLLDEEGATIPEADVVVPADIQNATLLLVGTMLRDPDGAESKDWDAGYLPRPVTSMLVHWRKPSLA